MTSRAVAVVGVGTIAPVHVAGIEGAAGARLAAVCDVDPDRARAGGERYGVPWFTDHRDLLARGEVEVIHVCTPHDQHVPLILDAVAAGVHVLTEKPLATGVGEAGRIVRAARQTPGVSVGVCLQNRYNPTVVALRDTLRSGRAGRPLGARADVQWCRTGAYYAAAPWRGLWDRAGGGVLINQAVHTLDLLGVLLGPPVRVTGWAGSLEHDPARQVEDTAVVHQQHSDGVPSLLFATNRNSTDAPVRLEVTTEDGVLRIDGGTLTFHPGGGADAEILAVDSAATVGRSYWGNSHGRLIADFHDCLATGRPFPVSPEESMTSLAALREVYAACGLIAAGER